MIHIAAFIGTIALVSVLLGLFFMIQDLFRVARPGLAKAIKTSSGASGSSGIRAVTPVIRAVARTPTPQRRRSENVWGRW